MRHGQNRRLELGETGAKRLHENAVLEGCSKKVDNFYLKTVDSNSPTKSIKIPSSDDAFSEAGDDVSTGRGAPHRAGAGV